MGSLKKINNLFIKDIFHGYCLKRQSLRFDKGRHNDPSADPIAAFFLTPNHEEGFPNLKSSVLLSMCYHVLNL